MADIPLKKNEKLGFRDSILITIERMVSRHTGLVIFASLALSVISVIYTIGNLQFHTGRSQLISQNLKYNQDFKKMRAEFGDYDGLIVVAKGENPDSLKKYVDRLGSMLMGDPDNFKDVFYKIDTEYFKNKMFLFLSEEEIHDLFSKLRENEGLITGLNEEPGLVNFFRQVNHKISQAMAGHLVSGLLGENSEGEEEGKGHSEPVDLSLINNVLLQMNAWLDGRKNYISPWTGFLSKGKDHKGEDGYITSGGGKIYLMTVNPVENTDSFSSAKKSVRVLRGHIASLKGAFPDVEAGVTGTAALESDEMNATLHDTTTASLIALVGVAFSFAFAFRGIDKPLLAMIALVASLCWTLGWTTLTIGHLNVISVVFITILIGLGIDFGIHLIMRYQEERKKDAGIMEALERTIRGTGKGIIVGAITTAMAFFTMAFADFIGIVELGIIAGSGILFSLLAMLIFLPAMLLVLEKNNVEARFLREWNRPDVTLHFTLLEKLLRYPKFILGIGLVILLAAFYFFSLLKFDYNILRLQNEATESVQYEMEIIEKADRSTWYGAMVVDSLEEARQLKKRVEALSTTSEVGSIFSVYPDGQEEKIQIVQAEKKNTPPVSAPSEDTPEEVKGELLAKTLKKIGFKLREEDDAWAPGQKPEEGSIRMAKNLMGEALEKLERMGQGAEPILAAYQARLFVDYRDKFSTLQESMEPTPIELTELPKALRDRYVGKTGKFLLQIFPRENIWDREPLDRFIADLRTVDPDTTGLAVQAGESARLMKEGYVQGGIYALITIVFITFLSFKRIKDALLAMSPLFIGFFWLVALMEFFDLRFNLANLVILPLIIGIGVDNGVHILARYQEGGIDDPVDIVFQSTGKAILLCSLTTMIGFGSLMVAGHYGIYSIGLLLTLGVGACLVASTTVFPLLLRWSEWGRMARED